MDVHGGSERAAPGARNPIARAIAPLIGAIATIQAGIMLAGLVRLKVLALETGTAGVGLQTVVEQIVTVVALVSTVSLPYAAIKFLSYSHSERPEEFMLSFAAFARMLLALSIVGTLVAVLVAVAWPGVFGAEVGGERGVLLLGLLAVPATNLLTLLTNAFAAVQRPIVSSVLMLAQFVAIAGAASVGVIVAGLEGYFAGTAAASFVVLVGGIVALRRLEGGSRPHRRTRVLAELRRHPDLLRFAAVQGILIITTPAAYLIARYAILQEGGLAEAGILAAAFALANVVTAALAPATRLVLVPAMNRREAATEKLRQALRFRDAFMLFAGILGLPLVLFPGTALELFFADGFREAESVLWIFIVAQVALGLGSINQGLLVGLDDYASTVVTVVAGQALMVVLTLSLVPSMGVAAVGLALLADYALVLCWTGWRLWRRHRMPIFKGLPTYSLVLLAAVAGLGALVPELPGSSPSLVAVKLALLAAFTLGAVAMARRMRLHVPMPAPAAT